MLDLEIKRDNRFVCVIGSEEHHTAIWRGEDSEASAAAKMLATEAAFWIRYCDAVIGAKVALAVVN